MASCSSSIHPKIGAPGPDGAPLDLCGAPALARASGALWAPGPRMLAVADLHLGKSERLARRGGALLPPYEGAETLERLGAEIAALSPEIVVSVGDAFDDGRAAAALAPALRARLERLIEGRRWIWIAGNHDPRPPGLGGEALETLTLGPLHLRHQAAATAPGAETVEISGHYHPKALLRLQGRRVARRCFLFDGRRLILPAFGVYVGGLDIADPIFDALMGAQAQALLLSGGRVAALPRCAKARKARQSS